MLKLDPDDPDEEENATNIAKSLSGVVPSGANPTTVTNPTATGSMLNESDQIMLLNYKVSGIELKLDVILIPRMFCRIHLRKCPS